MSNHTPRRDRAILADCDAFEYHSISRYPCTVFNHDRRSHIIIRIREPVIMVIDTDVRRDNDIVSYKDAFTGDYAGIAIDANRIANMKNSILTNA